MDKKSKKPYESPSTQCTLVEMEAGLCAASITDDAKKGVTVTSNTQDYEEVNVKDETDAFTWDSPLPLSRNRNQQQEKKTNKWLNR